MHNTTTIRRFSGIFVFAMLLGVSGAGDANAEGFVSPFFGYNFGGDSGCPQITNCDDKHLNWGIAFGALGSVVGFEAEVAHTTDFLGKASNQSTDVLTFMGNFMLAPKIGPVQPYGLGGIGLIRTSVDEASESNDENQIGWDVGGGLMVFFGNHIGIRGDIRYFHSFQILDLSKFPSLPINETKLDYGRAAVAAVFKF
jgi:opacity protein-like surface antigen